MDIEGCACSPRPAKVGGHVRTVDEDVTSLRHTGFVEAVGCTQGATGDRVAVVDALAYRQGGCRVGVAGVLATRCPAASGSSAHVVRLKCPARDRPNLSDNAAAIGVVGTRRRPGAARTEQVMLVVRSAQAGDAMSVTAALGPGAVAEAVSVVGAGQPAGSTLLVWGCRRKCPGRS
jgi:hypothetical protein